MPPYLRDTAATAILVFAVACAAKAEDRPSLFERTDTDANGVVSLVEFTAHMENRFARSDQNGDGVLTRAELVTLMSAHSSTAEAEDRVARMMARFDRNTDGRLTEAELPEPRRSPAQLFDRLDTDNDGGLTPAEMRNLRRGA